MGRCCTLFAEGMFIRDIAIDTNGTDKNEATHTGDKRLVGQGYSTVYIRTLEFSASITTRLIEYMGSGRQVNDDIDINEGCLPIRFSRQLTYRDERQCPSFEPTRPTTTANYVVARLPGQPLKEGTTYEPCRPCHKYLHESTRNVVIALIHPINFIAGRVRCAKPVLAVI